MASSRAYIPSMEVLRCLSRSRPLRCPFARPLLPTTFARSQRTKSTSTARSPKRSIFQEDFDKNLKKALAISPEFKKVWEETEAVEKGEKPPGAFNEVQFVEQDIEGRVPNQVIEIVKTKEDIARLSKTLELIKQHDQGDNPNNPSRELKRVLIDSLIANPNFSDFQDVLQEMRDETFSHAELQKMEAELTPQELAEYNDSQAADHMEFHNGIQELIDHPNSPVEIKEALGAFRDKWTDWKDFSSNEFRADLRNIERLAYAHPLFQENLAAYKAQGGEHAQFANMMEFDNLLRENPDAIFNEEDDFETRLKKIHAMIGEDKEFDAEILSLMDADSASGTEELEYDPTPDLELMLERISKFKDAKSEEEPDEDKLDPATVAEVDRIMAMPDLPKRLALIKECLDEVYAEQNDLTRMVQPSAPDPSTWDKSNLVTFSQRIFVAENDPEHVAALRRLEINLLPPFHVAPAIRHFNQALKLAYVGASDDVRRILWRSYCKARLIPTFLQSLSDDAWDILWYSQAVNWPSNQNRSDHLTILLGDLQAVGKDGPPTDPRTLNPDTL
ncbi:hypothetical protein B0J11DRAFT_209963 [Dendryphion nanum]|uniref:Uncharacterized protein n=1 Tax=Dendryphion nanum TaxID=256645 RepID=A0A9P9IV25_9PLEO|nr:hypothetical protein B0J11DRAFT_209963 [Dendryphion nanum]